VTNSWMASSTASLSPTNGNMSWPSSSRYRLPGIWAATWRTAAAGTSLMFVRWITRVGLLIAGSVARTSIARFHLIIVAAALGLADARS
jgi:hypothetical protein